ncbi:MAG: AraC family transcriptional regulator [Gemmatimonadaceae bacterium]
MMTTRAHVFAIPAATRFRRHAHEGGHLCVVLDGGFLERDRSSWRDVGPGTIRISGGANHDIDFGTVGAECLVVQFDDAIAAQFSAPRFVAADATLAQLTARVRHTLTIRSNARALRLDCVLTELLAQLQRRIQRRRLTSPPSWLGQVREMLHDLHGVPSVGDLARAVGVHRVHLARTFREHVGVSVTDSARRQRILYAVSLLEQGTMRLSEVAAEAGFADQSHLTRAIRATIGTTPAMLRASTLHPFKTPAETSN